MTDSHFEDLKILLPINSYTLTQARKIAQIYNESEGGNLGSPSCNDCVEKMKNVLQTRFNEHQLWLDMMERKRIKEAIEKATTETEKYMKED